MDSKTIIKKAITDLYINKTNQTWSRNDAWQVCRRNGIECKPDNNNMYYRIYDGNGRLIAVGERRYSQRKVNLCYKELKTKWTWVWEGWE